LDEKLGRFLRCFAGFLPNVKKGYLLLVFEIPSLKPAMLSKTKADKADVEVHIPDSPGDFGKVKMKSGEVYELVASADDFALTKSKWSTDGSHYEVKKGELHVFLKTLE
jgi:hypothetical protein